MHKTAIYIIVAALLLFVILLVLISVSPETAVQTESDWHQCLGAGLCVGG